MQEHRKDLTKQGRMLSKSFREFNTPLIITQWIIAFDEYIIPFALGNKKIISVVCDSKTTEIDFK